MIVGSPLLGKKSNIPNTHMLNIAQHAGTMVVGVRAHKHTMACLVMIKVSRKNPY